MAMTMMPMEGFSGSTMPTDHAEQLQLGIRIVQAAFQGKVSAMEQELRGLRITAEEQRANCAALQKKNSALEVELVESHQRSQQLAEENKELFKTVGSLRKQIGRLEHLKAAVLSSIQDDTEKEAIIGDTKALMNEEYLRSATPITASAMGVGAGFGTYSPAPLGMSGSASNFGSGSNFIPGSVPAADPMQIDGKAFFRSARGVLSHEAFSQFLASIKRLNSQQQTREETLNEARRLFGPGHVSLYTDFETLLNRQGL